MVRGDLHNPARDRVLRHFMETHKMKTANPFISKIKPKKFKKFKKVSCIYYLVAATFSSNIIVFL